MNPPWLTNDEVRDICEGLVQPAAQFRYLTNVLKVNVRKKPNGRPLVMRSAVEGWDQPATSPQQMQAVQQRTPVEPNRAGFKLVYGGR